MQRWICGNVSDMHRRLMLKSIPLQVQRCTLLSIKTGGCPETCNYCAQSSTWSKDVGLKAEKLMDLDSVYEVSHLCNLPDRSSDGPGQAECMTHQIVCKQAALRAKDAGSTRFCMGAAWRGPTQVSPTSIMKCHTRPLGHAAASTGGC